MSPISQAFFFWTLGSGASTGASTTIYDNPGLRECRNLTFLLASDTASTMSIGIEAGMDSTSPWTRMGSTAYALSTAGMSVVQMDGPLLAVRPYLIARTDSNAVARILLLGN